MKGSILLFLWLSFLFHNSSCSSAVVVNNAATTNSNGPQVAEDRNTANSSDQSSQDVENGPSSKPKDVVVFDGMNYIRKNGWKVPSRKDAYLNDTYDQGVVERVTKNGKQVRTKTIDYIFKTPWLYSQDFSFEGRNGFARVCGNASVSVYEVGVNVIDNRFFQVREIPEHPKQNRAAASEWFNVGEFPRQYVAGQVLFNLSQ